mmetsp:Transcript_15809/g.25970  ORF Transcript_15809/g.25970 Transcript_15809/m.25970 type:complete len:233 (-) Transcript_15809:673-1371(-)
MALMSFSSFMKLPFSDVLWSPTISVSRIIRIISDVWSKIPASVAVAMTNNIESSKSFGGQIKITSRWSFGSGRRHENISLLELLSPVVPAPCRQCRRMTHGSCIATTDTISRAAPCSSTPILGSERIAPRRCSNFEFDTEISINSSFSCCCNDTRALQNNSFRNIKHPFRRMQRELSDESCGARYCCHMVPSDSSSVDLFWTKGAALDPSSSKATALIASISVDNKRITLVR